MKYKDPKSGEVVVTKPDGKMADGQYVEVKSGGSVSNTKQLDAMSSAAAEKTGKPLVLVVNPGTTLSEPLKNNPNIKIIEKKLQ